MSRRFDRRLVTLPLVALATAAAVLVPTELVLRARYPAQPEDRCLNLALPTPHARAGCTSRVKAAEGPWVENRYNSCGYRSPTGCGALPPGRRRIAVIGSSTIAGTFVPEPEAIPARLAADLTAACGRSVETQTLAVPDFPLSRIAASAEEAQAMAPDLLLVGVTSYDLKNATAPTGHVEKPALKVVTETLQSKLRDFSTVDTAKRLFLSNERQYAKFIAMQGPVDLKSRSDIRSGMDVLSDQIGRIVALARRRGTPVILAYTPSREELVRHRLAQGGASGLSDDLRALAARYGVPFVDGLAAFPAGRTTSDIFYVANGHMNALGDRYAARQIAGAIARDITSFRSCDRPI